MKETEEVKVYQNRADVEADYENFKKDWTYDEERDTYTHKSGLEMGEDISGMSDIEILNLPQWEGNLAQAGMPRDDIETYLSVLSQQFQILVEKNPREEQKPSEEELEAWFDRHEKFILTKAKQNERNEEELAEMQKRHREFFEEKIKGR